MWADSLEVLRAASYLTIRGRPTHSYRVAEQLALHPASCTCARICSGMHQCDEALRFRGADFLQVLSPRRILLFCAWPVLH